MIVQEKIAESKHQKKQIAEVCTCTFFLLNSLFSFDMRGSFIEGRWSQSVEKKEKKRKKTKIKGGHVT